MDDTTNLGIFRNIDYSVLNNLYTVESLPFKPCRLVILTSEKWSELLRSIENGISFLLTSSDSDIICKIGPIAITLCDKRIFESLCDYCLGSEIDERSHKILSNSFILFSMIPIKLDDEDPELNNLHSSFISFSKDLSLLEDCFDCINNLAQKANEYLQYPIDK